MLREYYREHTAGEVPALEEFGGTSECGRLPSLAGYAPKPTVIWRFSSMLGSH